MTAFLLRWATPNGTGAHSETPTVEALLAEGWTVAGKDPRYDSVLMRKECDDESGE